MQLSRVPVCRLALAVLGMLAAPTLERHAAAQNPTQFARMRDQMVDEEIVAAGVTNERAIAAMRSTPRHEFVPLARRRHAYLDMAIPIGEEQTISPPFVVAYMTEQLDPQPGDKVLEIGTGSGYQAAVLSRLVSEVYTIEIVGRLGRRAAKLLDRLNYDNVHTRIGDGYLGWPEEAPFDKIIVTCSPEEVPQPLIDQLREGGRMVVPVGARYQQNLYLFTKRDGRLKREPLRGTFFVPMTGEAESQRRVQPDPANPQLQNGGFETLIGEGQDRPPSGWYYLRQAELVTAPGAAPQGRRYLRFTNEDPGRGCRALQSLPVDGRQVPELDVSMMARGAGISYGQSRRQWPYIVLTFYDEHRSAIADEVIGPLHGDFDWTQVQGRLRVPVAARDAILRIGLLGAVGELSVDDVRISRPPQGAGARRPAGGRRP